jgi:hypothetical protein
MQPKRGKRRRADRRTDVATSCVRIARAGSRPGILGSPVLRHRLLQHRIADPYRATARVPSRSLPGSSSPKASYFQRNPRPQRLLARLDPPAHDDRTRARLDHACRTLQMDGRHMDRLRRGARIDGRDTCPIRKGMTTRKNAPRRESRRPADEKPESRFDADATAHVGTPSGRSDSVLGGLRVPPCRLRPFPSVHGKDRSPSAAPPERRRRRGDDVDPCRTIVRRASGRHPLHDSTGRRLRIMRTDQTPWTRCELP